MLPSYHVVYYKNHAIHYMNGVYKVDCLSNSFISMTDAMKGVDELEYLEELFENIKQPNDKN